MLDLKEIRKLAEYEPEGGVLSLYLTTDRGIYPQEEFRTIFKSLSDSFEDSEGIARIEHFLEHEFDRRAKGLAIFSAKNSGLWRVYQMQVTIPNWLFHEPVPYVKPLLRLLEDHPRHLVALVGKEKARIFRYQLGEIEEALEMVDEVHGQHKKGGWSQARFQRHHENQVQHHLQNVAEEAFSVFQDEGFERLLVGTTTPEIRPVLEGLLHPWLKDRLAAWFEAEFPANLEDILERTMDIERELEAEEERELLADLKDGLGTTAVAGLDDTLLALQEGRLNMLVLKKGFAVEGKSCRSCGYLFTGPGNECLVCGRDIRRVDDLVDAASRTAMEKDTKVSFIEGDGGFEEMGSIGGLLRF
ncbi:MAG: Vms1/Ankzf1 family peptidyl-tRNA hydrolase [Actinomycetota bacterium]